MILLLLWVSGCDTFTPFEEPDRYFSVYGWLDTRQERQILRVIPVRQTPEVPGTFSARVQIVDVRTGAASMGRDSVITGSEPVFLSVHALQPVPGRHYRIIVEDASGNATHLTTAVPPLPRVDLSLEPATDTRGWLAQPVPVTHPGAYLDSVEVHYRVALAPEEKPVTVIVRYPELRIHREEGASLVTLAWERDRREVSERLGVSDSLRLVLRDVRLRLTLVDLAWHRYRLTGEEPGSTEHGFGIVAGVTGFDTHWVPSTTVADSLNYRLLPENTGAAGNVFH